MMEMLSKPKKYLNTRHLIFEVKDDEGGHHAEGEVFLILQKYLQILSLLISKDLVEKEKMTLNTRSPSQRNHSSMIALLLEAYPKIWVCMISKCLIASNNLKQSKNF